MTHVEHMEESYNIENRRKTKATLKEERSQPQ